MDSSKQVDEEAYESIKNWVCRIMLIAFYILFGPMWFESLVANLAV